MNFNTERSIAAEMSYTQGKQSGLVSILLRVLCANLCFSVLEEK